MEFHPIQQYLHKTVKFILIFLLAIFIVQQFFISVGHVGGTSMDPTMKDGQRFFINRAVYFLHPPRREDVVQMIDPYDEGIFIVKRVIGLPGETLLIRNQQVIIRSVDGTETLLDESYLPPQTETNIVDESVEFTVPEHHYFVLGDNRGSSKDSRVFGTIHRKYINGRVIQL